MPTIGSITKTVRINPRDLEVIESLMRDGSTWSGAIHKLCVGVPQINEPEYVHRLKQNGAAYGLSGGELAEKLMDSMDSGKIVYENGEFTCEMEEDISRLRDACHDKGIPVQKAIDTMTQMVRKA